MLKNRKFQRKIEDFVCEQCGAKTKGTGYTDHCPKCLWSKHVDVNPGDRQAECGGAMEPVSVEMKAGEYAINYRCLKCGFAFRVKAALDDDFEQLLRLAGK
jgi:hypothetical protein